MMAMLQQATCVAIGGRAVLIEGEPGVGKSSLALALIDRGAKLVGDDGVLLAAEADILTASPAPATKGLIEVRNLGLVPMDAVGAVPVALLIALDRNAPRYRERPEMIERNGVSIPCISLWPDSPVLALRAEWALKLYGL